MPQQFLMQVEKSVGLTGLGVLLLAQNTTSLLQSFDLYTQWPVRLVFPDGSSVETTASVEEVSRPLESGEAATIEARALLLAEDGIDAIPTGTHVYLSEPNS